VLQSDLLIAHAGNVRGTCACGWRGRLARGQGRAVPLEVLGPCAHARLHGSRIGRERCLVLYKMHSCNVSNCPGQPPACLLHAPASQPASHSIQRCSAAAQSRSTSPVRTHVHLRTPSSCDAMRCAVHPAPPATPEHTSQPTRSKPRRCAHSAQPPPPVSHTTSACLHSGAVPLSLQGAHMTSARPGCGGRGARLPSTRQHVSRARLWRVRCQCPCRSCAWRPCVRTWRPARRTRLKQDKKQGQRGTDRASAKERLTLKGKGRGAGEARQASCRCPSPRMDECKMRAGWGHGCTRRPSPHAPHTREVLYRDVLLLQTRDLYR
jgi:hypothetical protein